MQRQLIIFFIAISLIISCTKEEGKGGLAIIRGKVFGYDINTEEIITDSGYVANYDVFISYGDNTWVDDRTLTSPSGEYRFDGLTPGQYTLYVYSQCNSCLFNQETFIQTVEIKEAKETVTLPDFKIID
jgi:hypothetical protein